MATPDYRKVIAERFSERRLRNPAYSLRAFARDLALSPSHLSEVLRARENLSPRIAARLVHRLGLSTGEGALFVAAVQTLHGRSAQEKKDGAAQLKTLQRAARFSLVAQGAFDAITNWCHFSLLELFRLPQARGVAQPKVWAAKKLGLNAAEAEAALGRLQALGLIKEAGGSFEPTNANVETTNNVSSAAVRAFHEQILGKAAAALYAQGVDQRSVNSLVLAFPRRKRAAAAAAINDFCRQFNDAFGQDIDAADSVYCLSFQFFELTQKAEG